MRGIIVALALLLPSVLFAQGNRKKAVEVDTVKVAFFNGLALHADLIGALQTQLSDHGQYEIGARVNIKDKYFPAFELGLGQADEKEDYNEGHTYHTRAPYFRVGCDYNLLKNKHDDYKAFAGVRYGFASYKYDVTDNGLQTTSDAKNHWIEGIIGVDAKIKGPLHLGWDIRYRRNVAQFYTGEEEPWYVPGYGNNKEVIISGRFNLTIAF